MVQDHGADGSEPQRSRVGTRTEAVRFWSMCELQPVRKFFGNFVEDRFNRPTKRAVFWESDQNHKGAVRSAERHDDERRVRQATNITKPTSALLKSFPVWTVVVHTGW